MSHGGFSLMYAKVMLTFFKPWRAPERIKDNDDTWVGAFHAHEFSPRQKELMKFFNIRFECSDSRDDFNKLRKSKQCSEKGIYLGDNQMVELCYQSYYDAEQDEASGMTASDIDEAYKFISATHLGRLVQMKNAEAVLRASGALDNMDGEDALETELLEDHGEGRTAMEWQKLMKDKRAMVLKKRKQESNTQARDAAAAPVGATQVKRFPSPRSSKK